MSYIDLSYSEDDETCHRHRAAAAKSWGRQIPTPSHCDARPVKRSHAVPLELNSFYSWNNEKRTSTLAGRACYPYAKNFTAPNCGAGVAESGRRSWSHMPTVPPNARCTQYASPLVPRESLATSEAPYDSEVTLPFGRARDLLQHPVIRASTLQYAGLILGIAAGVAMARLGGAEVKGIFSAFSAAVVILGMLINLDFAHQALVLARSAGDKSLVLRSLGQLWKFYALGCLVLAAVCDWLVPAYVPLVIGAAAFTLCSHLNIAANGLVSSHYSALTAFAQQAIISAGVITLWLAEVLDERSAIGLAVLSYLLPVPFLVHRIRSKTDLASDDPGRVAVGPMLWHGLRWQPGRILHFAIMRADVVIVLLLFDASAAGVYSIGLTFASLTAMLPTQIGNYLIHKGARETIGNIDRLLFLAAFFAVALGVFLVIVGRPLINGVYGAAFAGAFPILLATLPGAIGYGLINMLANRARMSGLPGEYTLAMVLGATIMAAGIFVLQEPFGAVGVGIASSFGSVVAMVALWLAYRSGLRAGLGEAA